MSWRFKLKVLESPGICWDVGVMMHCSIDLTVTSLYVQWVTAVCRWRLRQGPGRYIWGRGKVQTVWPVCYFLCVVWRVGSGRFHHWITYCQLAAGTHTSSCGIWPHNKHLMTSSESAQHYHSFIVCPAYSNASVILFISGLVLKLSVCC